MFENENEVFVVKVYGCFFDQTWHYLANICVHSSRCLVICSDGTLYLPKLMFYRGDQTC